VSRGNTVHTDTRWHKRAFSTANVASTLVAVAVFFTGATASGTNRGILVSAIVAGGVAGFVWWLIARFTAGPTLESSINQIALLGAIPIDEAGPAPTLSDTDATDRYTGLLREIEGQTTGRILLVSSPGPGQGASTVSLNLAIAATKAGRRVMLVDADPSPNGLGRFLSTGSSPGLSDVAAGAATMSGAARMWELEDGTRFPMLPSGDTLADAEGLSGVLVADALDAVSERADLIIIDVPPVLWSNATPELGAHADGTILVVADSADPATVTRAIEDLSKAGAPVLGYVRNRSTGMHKLAPVRWRRAAMHGVITTALLLGFLAAYTGAQLWYSWNRVETEALDTSAVAATPGDTQDDGGNPTPDGADVELEPGAEPPAELPATTAPEQAYETFLLIGGDEVSGAADVILYLVQPTNGADAFMVSLPRDLYVENACTGRSTRINALIHGCESKDINGPSLLSYTVSQFTGIEVDHFAKFDFDGFEEIIDAVGGVEICVDYAVSDKKAKLSLPQGCTNATGAQALAWVRSRHTLQKVNGSWKSVPGASDLLRNQHQQDVIIELFKELKTFDSPSQLTAQVAGLADAFVLDNTLSLTDAVGLAWTMRDIDLVNVKRLEIPVRLTRSSTGQSIVVATMPFDELLASIYRGNLPTENDEARESASQANEALHYAKPSQGTE
jgi:LCP family protein required for cell wall assembly